MPQCLDSVINQTYQDLEIICVNDGSPGKCLDILEKYKKKDLRIIIVDKQNQGLERARYSGYAISTGDAIMHLDSDDWLEGKDTLELMYNTLLETDSDYVEVRSQRVMDRHGWIKKKNNPPVAGIIEQPKLFEDYYISYFGLNILNVCVWGKLYKREVIERAVPKAFGVTMGEDLVYNIQIFPHLRRVCFMDKVGHNYRFGGMTTHYNTHLMKDLKKIFLLKEKLIQQYGYNKASYLACIEMKNVLRSDICQQIMYKCGTKQTIMRILQQELSDPMWVRISSVGTQKGDQDPFYVALIGGDLEAMYDICYKIVKQNQCKRSLLKVMSYICTHL